MHVLSTVAERHHLGERVYSRPYALTLAEFHTLRERDRIDEVIAQSHRVAEAHLTAKAFNDPALLQEDATELQRLAGTMPTREEALADADKLMQRLAAIDAKRRG